MGYSPPEGLVDLVDSMKKAAGAFADADIPVVLGGGLAAWARGGPATDHDVDFFVRADDVERALQALADTGMRIERPPEGWLVKAWDGKVLVDLIHSPAGLPVDDGIFERATRIDVLAQPLLVASAGDVLASKILALTEQDPNLRPVLEIARALREQVDWEFVRAKVGNTPFGAAVLTLVERLGIVEPEGATASVVH
ncbi:MAG TPA: nucleotidyltransferase [Gaiellaceae bacterium]|nr:nucleotidyltransferase [Gaiellaceae bacterium]